MNSIKVEKVFAQKAIDLLGKLNLRDKSKKPKADSKNLFIPVIKLNSDEKKKLEEELKKNKVKFSFAQSGFEEIKKNPRNLKEELKNKLTEKELRELITSFNSLGDTAVIEIPDSLKTKENLIGEALMKLNKGIKVVLKKASAHEGEFRTHKVKVIAGEKRTKANYTEHGCKFRISLGKVFFSPRLSTERKRISKLIKKGEVIGAFFAGVGPFPIVFAKHSKMKKAIAIELNPKAIEDMKENIALNKVQGKVQPILGDVNKIVPEKYRNFFDRVVMPLPKGGENFLETAIISVKKNGVIHYYQFVEKDSLFKAPLHDIEKACKKLKKKFKVLRKAEVRKFSPKIVQVVVDFKVM